MSVADWLYVFGVFIGDKTARYIFKSIFGYDINRAVEN